MSTYAYVRRALLQRTRELRIAYKYRGGDFRPYYAAAHALTAIRMYHKRGIL